VDIDAERVVKDLVDYLMPELSPHEASLYLFLLRNSHLADDSPSPEIRIGQRTIAQRYGRGPKMAVPSRTHIVRQAKSLEEKGCIGIGDTTRAGTLYRVALPNEIPLVIEKLAQRGDHEAPANYYRDPEKRREVFERDDWKCQYCGCTVSEGDATLDHFVPRCNGGDDSKENLRTACLMCNSIKSGKSYEEAAVSLLESIKSRGN